MQVFHARVKVCNASMQGNYAILTLGIHFHLCTKCSKLWISLEYFLLTYKSTLKTSSSLALDTSNNSHVQCLVTKLLPSEGIILLAWCVCNVEELDCGNTFELSFIPLHWTLWKLSLCNFLASKISICMCPTPTYITCSVIPSWSGRVRTLRVISQFSFFLS